ncbi:XRE family transcriptional regulator [bacterium]|nr:XRE family transcriptional regulator [bacterium]
MSGRHKFRDLKVKFSPERLDYIEQKKQKLRADMALGELRQALQITQAQLAQKLNIKQPAISRLERRTDMYVSNIREVIEAMGGELIITAKFPDGEVKITNFHDYQIDK